MIHRYEDRGLTLRLFKDDLDAIAAHPDFPQAVSYASGWIAWVQGECRWYDAAGILPVSWSPNLDRLKRGVDPVTEAMVFAIVHHHAVSQVRKYTGEAYITHPAAVVELVRSVPHTPEMLSAAWLHDTVEDTNATLHDVRLWFGDTVAGLVEMLTDVSTPQDGLRAHRKAKDREHTAQASPQGKTIKLADLIHNTSSITSHDPAFAKVYLSEKALLLEVLKEGDETLWQKAHDLLIAHQR